MTQHQLPNSSAASARCGPTGSATTVESRKLLNTLPAPPRARPRHAARPVAYDRDAMLHLRRRFYDSLVEEMKTTYQISIRKWRRKMSGVAYELRYRDGRVKRMVTAPRPRSPVSASIFLHEVGHHAVGFRKYRPRCLEEFHVWQWAFAEMEARKIPIDERVLRHYRRSMYHYVRMAERHGLKQLPDVLTQFLAWPG